MKKITITILFCFFLLPLTATAESLTFSDSQKQYSFTIPEGWVEIPKTTIDEIIGEVVNQTGSQFIDYSTGFQLDKTPTFQPPYILVQEHRVNTPSYSEIVETIKNAKFSEDINRELDDLSELITNASFEDPFVDKKRNIILMSIEMDVANSERVKGLIAMFLGKEGVTQLNFYSLKSAFSENLSIFNQIIDSFRYEQGYEYEEEVVAVVEEAKKNDSSSIFEGVVKNGIVGGIMAGLVTMIFALLSLSKKKKEGK